MNNTKLCYENMKVVQKTENAADEETNSRKVDAAGVGVEFRRRNLEVKRSAARVASFFLLETVHLCIATRLLECTKKCDEIESVP